MAQGIMMAGIEGSVHKVVVISSETCVVLTSIIRGLDKGKLLSLGKLTQQPLGQSFEYSFKVSMDGRPCMDELNQKEPEKESANDRVDNFLAVLHQCVIQPYFENQAEDHTDKELLAKSVLGGLIYMYEHKEISLTNAAKIRQFQKLSEVEQVEGKQSAYVEWINNKYDEILANAHNRALPDKSTPKVCPLNQPEAGEQGSNSGAMRLE